MNADAPSSAAHTTGSNGDNTVDGGRALAGGKGGGGPGASKL